MTTQLLITKSRVPPGRHDLLSRDRLLERLERGLDGALMLVSAPPGYGKTTLLVDWAHRTNAKVGWLAVDRDDNDPSRFRAYLVSALQHAYPDALADAGSNRDGDDWRTDDALGRVLNTLADAPDKVVLVIDDYHLISESTIHETVAHLVEHCPPQLHLVVATRADPPLPIALWRGRGMLCELRQADLQFTDVETSLLFDRVMELDLAPADVGALAARTEGWVAGLQLAALSVRAQEDPSGFVRAFSGSHRFVLDYLMEEVLAGQSADVQDFLVSTSVLRHLCGPLCDAVAGRDDSQALLEMLERRNLFVVALDDDRHWYRYHRLFADLLLQRLESDRSADVRALHRRAAAWHEETDDLEQAIEHRLAAGDDALAAELMERAAEATLMRSELLTFNGWIDRLPADEYRRRPALCAAHAWSLLLSGQPASDIEASIAAAAKGTVSESILTKTLRAFLAIYQGRMDVAELLAREAMTGLPPGPSLARTAARWVEALTTAALSDPPTAKSVLEDVARSAQGEGNTLVAVVARCQIARVQLQQGLLHDARATYERALAAATLRTDRLPIASEPLLGMAEIERRWNHLGAAEHLVHASLGLFERWGTAARIDAHLVMARVRRAQRDFEAASTELAQAAEIARAFDVTELDDRAVRMERARLSIDQGDVAAAGRWADEIGVVGADAAMEAVDTRGTAEYHLLKYELLVLGRFLLLAQRPAEALSLLSPLRERMAARGRVDIAVEALAMEAAAHDDLGDGEGAVDVMAQAAELAAPGGDVTVFLEGGSRAARLLHDVAGRGVAADFVGSVLTHFPDAPASEDPGAWRAAALVEPLSQRELQVLALIADGLTNQEIAHDLGLSVATVKWHTSHIYSKLGVHSRTQAVRRAQGLGLLSTG